MQFDWCWNNITHTWFGIERDKWELMWRCFAEASAVPHSIIYRSRGGLSLVAYMTANLKSIRKEPFSLDPRRRLVKLAVMKRWLIQALSAVCPHLFYPFEEHIWASQNPSAENLILVRSQQALKLTRHTKNSRISARLLPKTVHILHN